MRRINPMALDSCEITFIPVYIILYSGVPLQSEVVELNTLD